jgi:hypothetical protein
VADLDGDRICDILVGAPFHRTGAAYDGAAYIFSGADGVLLRRILGAPHTSKYFGTAVDVSPDRDGDGMTDFIITEEGTSGDGVVRLYANHPFLGAFRTEISASAGGALALRMNYPLGSAQEPYRILVSASGRGPFLYEGVQIPLTADWLSRRTAAGDYGLFPFSSGLEGVLDADGKATAYAVFPPGSLAGQVGLTFHLAAVVRPGRVGPPIPSVARSLRVLP